MRLLLIIPIILLTGFLSYAQNYDDYNYYSVKLGVNSIDSGGDQSPFDSFTNTEEMAFSNPFALGADYRFSRLLSAGLFASINKWKANKNVLDLSLVTEDVNYFAIDLNVKVYVDELIFGKKNYDKNNDGKIDAKFDKNGDGKIDNEKKDWLDLYISLGGGYFSEISSDISGNVGAGANIWVADKWGVNIEGMGKFSEEQVTHSNHFQYFAGITYRFIDTDRDNDGIKDKKDKCPDVYGPKENEGCPWPDADGDGIFDKDDECPDVPGPEENNGCPWPDSDGDGVLDKDDECPDVFGTIANNGCPEEEVEVEEGPMTDENINQIVDLAKNINFDTDSYNFKQESYAALQQIVALLKKYPNAPIRIEGHTDSVGSSAYNEKLSQDRADAVKSYLIGSGVKSSSIISSIGYGESKPIASNLSKVGKSKNRRVEIINN